jgi:hypothetical protein
MLGTVSLADKAESGVAEIELWYLADVLRLGQAKVIDQYLLKDP